MAPHRTSRQPRARHDPTQRPKSHHGRSRSSHTIVNIHTTVNINTTVNIHYHTLPPPPRPLPPPSRPAPQAKPPTRTVRPAPQVKPPTRTRTARPAPQVKPPARDPPPAPQVKPPAPIIHPEPEVRSPRRFVDRASILRFRYPRMFDPQALQDPDYLMVPEFGRKPRGWKPSPPPPGSDRARETRQEYLARQERKRQIRKYAAKHPRDQLEPWREVPLWAAPQSTRPDVPKLVVTSPRGNIMGLKDPNTY